MRLAALAIAMVLCARPEPAAAAPANRVWVSGHGADAPGCGAPTAPCRSLQYAHDNAVAAGGEIDILDPAGYGAVTITKAISIVNDGVGTAGVQTTSGTAISIQAGAGDSIYLRGLNLDGVNASGSVGVEFDSGKSLTVVDCVARHFRAVGFSVIPTAGFTKALFQNTRAVSNSGHGFFIRPEGSGSVSSVLDHVTAIGNGNEGVFVIGTFTTGTVAATVSHALAVGNEFGVAVNTEFNVGPSSNMAASVDHSQMYSNQEGLYVGFHGVAHLYASSISVNGEGTHNLGQIFSSGDNHIDGNGADMVDSGLTPEPAQ